MADRVYIAGPMTGLPEYNFPAFHRAEDVLSAAGFVAINPARTDGGSTHKPRQYYLREAIKMLLTCQRVYMLNGWSRSDGAKLEKAIAHELDMCVWYEPGAERADNEIESILVEADGLVNGARRSTYGHPLDDYERTAALWSAILGVPVTAEQAILCMIAVKISRECNRHGRDNLVDVAGYAQCLEMVYEERDRRAARDVA